MVNRSDISSFCLLASLSMNLMITNWIICGNFKDQPENMGENIILKKEPKNHTYNLTI